MLPPGVVAVSGPAAVASGETVIAGSAGTRTELPFVRGRERRQCGCIFSFRGEDAADPANAKRWELFAPDAIVVTRAFATRTRRSRRRADSRSKGRRRRWQLAPQEVFAGGHQSVGRFGVTQRAAVVDHGRLPGCSRLAGRSWRLPKESSPGRCGPIGTAATIFDAITAGAPRPNHKAFVRPPRIQRTSNSIQRRCRASRSSAARATSQCGAPISLSVCSSRFAIDSNARSSTAETLRASRDRRRRAPRSAAHRRLRRRCVRSADGRPIREDVASLQFMADSKRVMTLVRLRAHLARWNRFVLAILVSYTYQYGETSAACVTRLSNRRRAPEPARGRRGPAYHAQRGEPADPRRSRSSSGFRLFERQGRRVVLNPAGEALLRSTRTALLQLDEGVQAAAAAATGSTHALRVTVLPSFAHRWLLPRIGRWRERHPHLALEIDSSQQLVDLQREGFHAALRYGNGTVAGPRVGAPVRHADAHDRRRDRRRRATASERAAGSACARIAARRTRVVGALVRRRGPPDQGDAGRHFQRRGPHAAGGGAGPRARAVRELLAADALADGRLARVSALSIAYEPAHAYHLVYPPSVRDWPPLAALRQWLRDELELSRGQLELTRKVLHAPAEKRKRRTGNAESRVAPSRPTTPHSRVERS